MTKHLSDRERIERLESQVAWLTRQIKRILRALGLDVTGEGDDK